MATRVEDHRMPRLPRLCASVAFDSRGVLRAGLFRRFLMLVVPVLAAGLNAAEEPDPQASASCLECHSDHELTERRPDGTKYSLFVDAKQVARSAHGSFECVDCHEGIDGAATPHRKKPVSVDCFSCHDDTGPKHKFHPRLMQKPMPAGKDTACVACHGGHGIERVKSSEFAFAKGRVTEGCAQCHEKTRNRFLSSVHGKPRPAAPGAAAPAEPSATITCLTCHQDPLIATHQPVSVIEQKLAWTKLCESCHVEKPAVASQTPRGMKFVTAFDQSVHGAALHAGKEGAATCVDCHGAHGVSQAIGGGSRMSKQNQAATCGKCHQDQARDFDSSVHAAALRKGNADSAVCTDCHGEHNILGHKDPASPVYERNVARQVCATCHDSLRLTQKYGLSSQAFQTFSDSYHGLAARGGAVEVVNCASCHSAHAIKSSLDPTSTIHKANLARTCGECHPGANTRFTVGSVHVNPTEANSKDQHQRVLYLVASIYVWLIVVVIGGMALHNLLDLLKKIRRKLAIQKGLIEPEHVAHRLYLRMTVHERLQHGALVISFVLLVVTGFMLRYPEAWWVVGIRHLSAGAFEWRSLIHRIAGVVMLTAGAWHISYLAFTRPGRALLRDLLPRWRDVTDPWKVLRYNLGLSPTKPAFPRFSYIEKAEYWALVWGTLLMGVTGMILWFDNTSMGLITKLGFDISRTIHFYEAILATLAIIVWHFYFVIFNPDIYPMNLSWLTGRMSEEEMLEEHPLELARLKAAADAKKKAADEPPPPAT